MDIQKHIYIATPGEITTLAASMFDAESLYANGRTTYLKALVATTQADLPKGKPEKSVALAALEATNERFYAAVVAAANASIPARTANRPIMLNRKTNFARSSVTAIRAYIRAGNDLMKVNPRFATKRALAVPARTRAATPARLKVRVERLSKGLMGQVLLLAEADKATAIQELNVLLGQVAAQLQDLGVHATRMRGGSLYVPVSDTQVLRQTASPS